MLQLPSGTSPQTLSHQRLTADLKYTNVTSLFNEAVAAMPPGKAVVSPHFDMLEGARALELGNPRLDTGLMTLEPDHVAFDLAAAQPPATVAAAMNNLTVLYVSWLGGLALLTTVLSSRYMLDYLLNYKALRQVRCGFGLAAERAVAALPPSETTNYTLVNTVLRAFVAGLAKTIGFTLRVATEVLYDEEDLITRNMDLDFLGQTLPQEVLAELAAAELWLAEKLGLNDDPAFQAVALHLQLVRHLVLLEPAMAAETALFSPESLPRPVLDKRAILAALDQIQGPFGPVPAGLVSTLVQIDCSNKHIPAANVAGDPAQAHASLRLLVEQVADSVAGVGCLQNVLQLDTYLQHHIGQRMASTANPFARGFFQLFLVRDDRAIAGSQESVGLVCGLHMALASLCGNSIMDPHQWTCEERLRGEALAKIGLLLDNLESMFFQKMTICGNNRCRQRQLYTRSIVSWDLLQAQAEQMEAEFFAWGIGDRLSADFPDQPALGITLYVYAQKLDVMADVVLSGFEHDLYAVSEVPMLYRYAALLFEAAHEHWAGRVCEINRGKLALAAGLAKKIKKTKAGPKKDALREVHRVLTEQMAPDLARNVEFIELHVAPTKLALARACAGIAAAIGVLVAKANAPEGKPLTSVERIYTLRMKPWLLVGTPEVPTYEEHSKTDLASVLRLLPEASREARVQQETQQAQRLLTEAIAQCDVVLANLAHASVRERVQIGELPSEPEAFFGGLKKTCGLYKALVAKRGTGRLVRDELYLPYFPIYRRGES